MPTTKSPLYIASQPTHNSFSNEKPPEPIIESLRRVNKLGNQSVLLTPSASVAAAEPAERARGAVHLLSSHLPILHMVRQTLRNGAPRNAQVRTEKEEEEEGSGEIRGAA